MVPSQQWHYTLHCGSENLEVILHGKSIRRSAVPSLFISRTASSENTETRGLWQITEITHDHSREEKRQHLVSSLHHLTTTSSIHPNCRIIKSDAAPSQREKTVHVTRMDCLNNTTAHTHIHNLRRHPCPPTVHHLPALKIWHLQTLPHNPRRRKQCPKSFLLISGGIEPGSRV